MLTLLLPSNEVLNDLDPLFLGTHEGVASAFVLLLHFCTFLLMSSERLTEYLHCLRCREISKLFEFVVRETFWIENEIDIRRLWRRNLSSSCAACFCSFLISFYDTYF